MTAVALLSPHNGLLHEEGVAESEYSHAVVCYLCPLNQEFSTGIPRYPPASDENSARLPYETTRLDKIHIPSPIEVREKPLVDLDKLISGSKRFGDLEIVLPPMFKQFTPKPPSDIWQVGTPTAFRTLRTFTKQT